MRWLFGIWRRHKLLTGAFLLAGLLTVFFGVRMVVFTVYWSDPAHRDQTLQGWMTPGYVQNSWQIDTDRLQAAIGPAAQPGQRLTLDEIAARQNEPLADLIARIEAAIAAARAGVQ